MTSRVINKKVKFSAYWIEKSAAPFYHSIMLECSLSLVWSLQGQYDSKFLFTFCIQNNHEFKNYFLGHNVILSLKPPSILLKRQKILACLLNKSMNTNFPPQDYSTKFLDVPEIESIIFDHLKLQF